MSVEFISDEIFKEQNKIAEEIKALQVAKNDDLLLKYNLEGDHQIYKKQAW